MCLHGAAVFAAKAGIDTLKSQIREIKVLDKCAECGAEIVGDAVFCPKCGKIGGYSRMCKTLKYIDQCYCKRCNNSSLTYVQNW